MDLRFAMSHLRAATVLFFALTAALIPVRAAQSQTAPPLLVRIGDSGGRFTLETPADWRAVAEGDWSVAGAVVGTQVTATPDLAAFSTDWGTPGVIVSFSEQLPAGTTLPALLDQVDLSAACQDAGRDALTVGALTGFVQRWERCGGSGTTGTVAALAPADNPQFFAILEIYTPASDQALAAQILASFTANTGALIAPTPTPPSALDSSAPVAAPPSRPGLAYTYAARREPAVVALLPAEFAETVTEPWLAAGGEPLGYQFAAAPDLAAFRTTWGAPGLVARTAFSLTRPLDAAALLDGSGLAAACAAVERSERVHATPAFTYTILLDSYLECGGASTYTLAVAQSEPVDHLLFLEFQAVSAADRAALDIFLESFTVERIRGAEEAAAASQTPVGEPSAAPTAAPTPTPTPVQPTGVVLANNLNVRSGPGTGFERLGAAPRGTTLAVAGQLDGCAWLRIDAPGGLSGWVSGDPEFITLDTPCASIPITQP